jgi:4-hydroxybenzoate polyprenyltransferase
MISHNKSALVVFALREMLLGKRGLIKLNLLWLPMAVYVSFFKPEEDQDMVLIFLLLFLSIGCWALGNILANDLCDSQIDLEAGKKRWICALHPQIGAAVVALIIAAGFGIQIFGGSWPAVGTYFGATAFGLGYSLNPFRFKERGAWGVLAYSLACALAYVLVPYFWMKPESIWLVILFPVVLLDKWVNLHFHHILDYDADSHRGIDTLAVRSGQTRSRKWLKNLSLLSSILFVSVFVLIARQFPGWFVLICGLGAGVLVAAYVFVRVSKSRPSNSSSLVEELPWSYLGLTLALFRLLPVMLFLRLALIDDRMWIPCVVASAFLGLESFYNLCYRYE